MEGLSQAAQDLCLKFSFGEKATVTSNPPHAEVLGNRAAWDELIDKRIITVRQTGKSTFEYKGTPRSMEIAHEIMKETHL